MSLNASGWDDPQLDSFRGRVRHMDGATPSFRLSEHFRVEPCILLERFPGKHFVVARRDAGDCEASGRVGCGGFVELRSFTSTVWDEYDSRDGNGLRARVQDDSSDPIAPDTHHEFERTVYLARQTYRSV